MGQWGTGIMPYLAYNEEHPNFLDQDHWDFKIYYEDDNKQVLLGNHYYTIDYDGLVILNGIEYHQVQVSFIIDYDEYSDYLPVTIT